MASKVFYFLLYLSTAFSTLYVTGLDAARLVSQETLEKIEFLTKEIMKPCGDYYDDQSLRPDGEAKVKWAVCLFQKMRPFQEDSRHHMFRPLTQVSIEYQVPTFQGSLGERLKAFDSSVEFAVRNDRGGQQQNEIVVRIFYRRTLAQLTISNDFIGLNYFEESDNTAISSGTYNKYLGFFLDEYPTEIELETYLVNLYAETTAPSNVPRITLTHHPSTGQRRERPLFHISRLESTGLVSLHLNPDCSDSPLASVRFNGSSSEEVLYLAPDRDLDPGDYTFYAGLIYGDGQKVCSRQGADYTKFDSSRPTAMIEPVGDPSAPEDSEGSSGYLMRVVGVNAGDQVSLYTDPTCSQGQKIASGAVEEGLTYIDFNSSSLKSENYVFYMEIVDLSRENLSCSVVMALYSPMGSMTHTIPAMIGLKDIAVAEEDNHFVKIPRLVLEESYSRETGEESTPLFQISNLLPESSVSLHTDSGCTDSALASARVSGSSSSVRLRPTEELEPEKRYTFYAKALSPSGKSSCSFYGVSYQFFKTPKVYAYFRESPDASIIPVVMHVEDAEEGDQISIFANDSSCSDSDNLVVETVLTSSSDYVDLSQIELNEPENTFYVRIKSSRGRISLDCFPTDSYLGQRR